MLNTLIQYRKKIFTFFLLLVVSIFVASLTPVTFHQQTNSFSVSTAYAQDATTYATTAALSSLPVIGPILGPALAPILTSGNAESGTALENLLTKVMTFLLGVLVSLFAGILTIVSIAFNFVVEATVTDFSSLFSGVEKGITAAWSGFRDVANIVMIAMFVFLSFSVMLNIQKYGLKQLGVRILIVAVLINFSLFFTKAFIDVTNITALQFYEQMQVMNGGEGISDTIMRHAGITNFLSDGAQSTLDEIANSKTGGVGSTLMYTLVIIIMFIALSLVLLYGIILLVTRTVVLLILMMLSSAAAAATIIPSAEKWWDTWLSNLVKNGLFAPAFFMMLWGILNIIQAMNSVSPNEATIAALVQKEGGAWEALLNVMIIIGLLYAATRVADSLSLSAAKKFNMKAFSLGIRGLGGGLALGGGLRVRNLAARNAARAFASVGAYGTASRFDAMAQKTHINDTALGKKLSGAGIVFGSDRSKDAAKYGAKYETEKEEAKNAPVTEARNEQLSALNADGIKVMRQNAANVKKLDANNRATGRKLDEDMQSTKTSITSAQTEKSDLAQKLKEEQAKKDNENLSAQERLQAEKEVSAAQKGIAEQDEKIKSLESTLDAKQKEREQLSSNYETELNKLVEGGEKEMNDIKSRIGKLRKAEAQDAEFRKEAVREAIDSKKFVGRRIKDMVKSEIGKSDIDRIAETIQTAMKKEDGTSSKSTSSKEKGEEKSE